MGGSGGKKSQKKAKKDPLASSPDVADQATTPCKAALKVKVIRADTQDVVEGINVKAGDLGPEATVSGTGIADFGDVEAASYKIAVELDEEQKEQYVTRDPVTKVVSHGVKLETTVAIDPAASLRMVLIKWNAKDKKDEPQKDLMWKLTKPTAADGTTGSDGLIDVPVLPQEETGEIEVVWREAGETEDPVAEAGAATDYPIKIKYDDWKHKPSPPAVPKEADHTIKWSLAIADLEDGDGDDGVQARLYNIGFPVDDDEMTKRSVKAYQALYLDEPDGSGAISDVTDDVKERHDKP